MFHITSKKQPRSKNLKLIVILILFLSLIIPCFPFVITTTTHTNVNKTLRLPPSSRSLFTLNSSQRKKHNPLESIVRNCSALLFRDRIDFLPSLGLNVFLFFSLRKKILKMLTPEGFAHSMVLGTFLFTTLGWKGWTCAVLYLFLGSFVTKIKFQEKKDLGIEEKREGRRGPENVWGSALTGLITACASCISCGKIKKLYILAFVTSFATKLSDTFASEIGKAYGKTTFLITTMKKVPPGTEGAVSLEGTLAALLGASLLPCYAFFIGLIPSCANILVATFAAFLATFAESWIGASLQNKAGFEFMTNEVVNFLNTLIGASLAMIGGNLVIV